MIAVEVIAPEEAACALAGLESLDPTGDMTAAELHAMCERGVCLRLEQGGQASVMVIRDKGSVLWISALKGQGLPAAIVAGESIARSNRKSAIAFQTARPGLVRQMQRRGYRVSGWIMTKDME